jgi:hypothetical protein
VDFGATSEQPRPNTTKNRGSIRDQKTKPGTRKHNPARSAKPPTRPPGKDCDGCPAPPANHVRPKTASTPFVAGSTESLPTIRDSRASRAMEGLAARLRSAPGNWLQQRQQLVQDIHRFCGCGPLTWEDQWTAVHSAGAELPRALRSRTGGRSASFRNARCGQTVSVRRTPF